MASTTILELAEEHRQKYFPGMKFTIVPAFYNKPVTYNLADSIKGHLTGYDYDHFYSPTTEFQNDTFEKQISLNHTAKLMDLVATRHPSSIYLPSPVL
jgi:hypothetical protein